MITCAIQIGSSRILAIGANKDLANGRLSNIQIESEPAHDCISHGCVVNIEKTAMHLRSLIQKLSNRMGASLASAYVGMGGMSLHSLVQLPSVQLPNYDVLDSESISGNRYQLTIGQKYLRQGVMAAMERAGIEVASIITLPQATSCILTDDERQRGCVLIDMGAGTTTVSIYKDNDLCHLAVIPLGGEAVTFDIMSLGCEYNDAEQHKLDWSNVSREVTSEPSAATAGTSLIADKALPFPLQKLNNVALCRYEEIAANIAHQIEISGLKDQLQAGCIVTGGASMQNGLTALLSRCLSISRVEVRAYNERSFVGSGRKPHLTNALALLSFCAEDCQAKPKPVAPASPTVADAISKPASQTATIAPDGQIRLDIPDNEEPKTDHKTVNENAMNLRNRAVRFVKDLFTGQDYPN